MTGSVNIREYKALNFNSHQENSNSIPFLDYFCDKLDFQFRPGVETVFHYPYNAKNISIHDTSLIDNGASMALTPAYADKVFKRLEGYANTSIYGNPSVQNGTWLCSWLSGDPTDPDSQAVWMDRWLLSGWTPDGQGNYNVNGEMVSDVYSVMTFEPGCYYVYDRVGNSTIETAVSAMGLPDALKINVTGTEMGDVLGVNDVKVYNPTNSDMRVPSVNLERRLESAISLNGSDQALEFAYSDYLSLTGDSSVCFWGYSSDWHDIKGDSIVDNGFRGGWRFFSDKGINTKFMCFANNINSPEYSTNSSLVWYNTDGKIIQHTGFDVSSRFKAMAIDSDLYTWTIDNAIDTNNHKNIYKIDYTGNTILKIPLNDTYSLSSKRFTDLQLGASGVYAFFKDNSTSGTGFVPFNMFDGSIEHPPVFIPYDNYNSVTMDLNGSPVFSLSAFIEIDNNGTEVLPMSSETNQTCVAINRDNNRLFGYSDGYVRMFSALDSPDNTIPVFETDTGLTSVSSIEFSIEYSDTEKIFKDYAYVIGNGISDVRVVKIDNLGNIVNYIYPVDVFVMPHLKNFTSFNYERKKYFSRLLEDSVTFEISTINPDNIITKYRMSKKASELSDNDWHHFGFIKRGRVVSFYVDCKIEDQILIPSDESVFYLYKTPLVLGADVGKFKLLDDELKISNGHFKGYLDDFRFYDRALSRSDFYYIYMMKYDKKVMNWVYDTNFETYTEGITRWFKFKSPGYKSPYFDITIAGLNITDSDIKSEVEDIIRDSVYNTIPAYAEIKDINWN